LQFQQAEKTDFPFQKSQNLGLSFPTSNF